MTEFPDNGYKNGAYFALHYLIITDLLYRNYFLMCTESELPIRGSVVAMRDMDRRG